MNFGGKWVQIIFGMQLCNTHQGKLAKIDGHQDVQFFGELVLCPVCCLLILRSGFGLPRIGAALIYMEEVTREKSKPSSGRPQHLMAA